ncbi:MAG: DNA-formamidopyrimidine glycosylase family protein [Gemmatales bacterium]
MPELPDLTIYIEALQRRMLGKKLQRVRLNHPFLLKTVEPGIESVAGREVCDVRRIAKRIAIGVEGDVWLVIHLMLAGRFHWKPAGFKLSRGYGLAAFDVADGCLVLTEAGSKRRASLHVVQGEAGLVSHDPGGLEVMTATAFQLQQVLHEHGRNRAIKKVLTDPAIISGIGNAYSDEILHRARMSPFAIAHKLDEEDVQRLHSAIRDVMSEWIGRLREEVGNGFPEKVTAFRPGMAVHGKYGHRCPVCNAPIQRIRYADKKETNYCPGCQTGGKLLVDRVMSRLLKDDRPKHLDDLEEDE